jgi:hypothetical protein
MMRVLPIGLLLIVAGCKCLPCPEHTDECRAGCPNDVSPCAKPSDTGHYVGYQVGGGAVPCCCCKGETPTCDEGTWGWDYEGICWPSKIILNWWHGRRYQGGAGAYRTDGPRPLKRLEQKKESETCCDESGRE